MEVTFSLLDREMNVDAKASVDPDGIGGIPGSSTRSCRNPTSG
jgi:hypothetical protein